MEKLDCKRLTFCRTRLSRVLIAFIMLLCLTTGTIAATQAYSKVTIKAQKAPIKTVLKELEKQTKLHFMYEDIVISNSQKVTLDYKNASLLKVLDDLCQQASLTYEIKDKHIFLFPAKKDYSPQQKKALKVVYTVTDDRGVVLPGVSVNVMKNDKTFTGAMTDNNGQVSITIPSNSKVKISFLGFKEKILNPIDDEMRIITMEGDQFEIDNVVVTGYQTLRKSDVVGSVTTIKGADVMMPAYSSISHMLQGRVAGMVVMNNSSRVGTSPKIRIRGTSTILGNQDPLWVVDGVIQPDPIHIDQNDLLVDDLKNILGNQISWLNPVDIETITVLKDASATAIYGSKAANGVIVITTKRGHSEDVRFNYSGTFSYRTRPSYGQFDLMNSQERVQFSREAFEAGALYTHAPIASMYNYEGIMKMYYDKDITKSEAESAIYNLENANTDWFKALTRNSFSHSHNLSLSGGSEKVIYNVSLGYNDQSGVEINNDASILSGRINLGMKLHPKINLDVTLVGSINKTWGSSANVNLMNYATSTSRAVLLYDNEGNRVSQERETNYVYNENPVTLKYNILNELDHSYSKNKNSQLNGNLNFSWDILPWLRYEFTGGINNNAGISEAYAGEQTYYVAQKYRGYDFGSESQGSEKFHAAMLPYGGELYNGVSDVLGWNIQNKLLFSKTINDDHRINVLVGTEVSSTKTESKSQKTYGYVKERGESIVKPTPIDEIVPIGGGIAVDGLGIFSNIYNGEWVRNTMTTNQFSVFATLAYSLKNRYVLNASIRNDASNRFGQDQNKRFDPTYSLGLSWNVAQEPWMRSISKVLNQFNLRASYGIQGNVVNSISPELILSMGGIKPFYDDYMSYISRIPNPHLGWERTKTWNFGLDVQLFYWITMSLEYYTKSSNNIINQTIALEYGRDGTEINGGKIVNSGVEYSLNITPIRTKDWGWTIGLNSSKNWNKARTRSISEIFLTDYLSGSASKVLKEGYATTSFWSFAFKGLNKQDGTPEFNLLFEEDSDGNIQKNENGNPILRNISELTDMLVYSGKLEPDFTGGITTRLRWKDLSLGMNFTLLLGASQRLPSPYPVRGHIPLSDVNVSKELNNRWKAPGDEARTHIPGVYTGRIDSYWDLQDDRSYNMYSMWGESDIMVVKSDFFRCQQISLTWNINEKWCKRIGAKSLSVSAIMNNVFVIADKKFNGFDPELGNSVHPQIYSMSINLGF